MGGFAGLVAYRAAATGAPRLSVVAEGATHCHVYIPFGSECALWPGTDRGYMAGPRASGPTGRRRRCF